MYLHLRYNYSTRAMSLYRDNELALGIKLLIIEKTNLVSFSNDRNKVIIEDGLISDDEETDVSKVKKETAFNSEISGKHLLKTGMLDLEYHSSIYEVMMEVYYPRMDNRRPRISSYSPSSRSSTTRTPHRPHRPKKIVKSIWVKKGSTVGSQAVLPQTGYGFLHTQAIEYVNSISGSSGSMTETRDKLSDFKEFQSYVEELKFNLLSVSQICDKKHNVLFTDKECLILSPKFKFVDEDLGTEDGKLSMAQKTGACQLQIINIGKQHRASCKKIEERTVREPLELLHMDLFGPVSVESVNRKKYCLRENKLRHKVKTIRCDHGTEFKNQLMNEFCAKKGIKREYSIARTPQQNGVAERKNRTLIEAARTMLADSLLPIQFWAEAVNTACYVLNRVLVTKPQMKTPYESWREDLLTSKKAICWDTLLTAKVLGVFYTGQRKFKDCLHVNFLGIRRIKKGKAPAMHPEERMCKEVSLSYEDKLYMNELYFHSKSANYTSSKYWHTPTDSDDDIPKDGVFSTNSFDAEEGGVADFQQLKDPTIDVSLTLPH
ncbi:ribonuclease H-like domain-containing protein [Tanacetum coccineum]|uniref:Ribonuclease H-like domain-containing protein n=1 Tax=Tanacetum coccineum TaxID=301880 RepID=A0ABQ5C5F7_9ASTR